MSQKGAMKNKKTSQKEPNKKVKDTMGASIQGSVGSGYRQQYATQAIMAGLQQNQSAFQQIFDPDKNYDIIERQLEIGGRSAVLYMIDGFTDAGSLQRMIQFFYSLKPDSMPENGQRFMEQMLPYGEVGVLEDMDAVASAFLAGITCLFIDGYNGM